MKKHMTVDAVKKKIIELKGNISAVARSFDCDRGTIYARIDKSDTLKKALKDSRETMIDNVESRLYQNALNGDTTAMIFFLKTQGKARGYVERTEHAGAADGEPMKFEFTWKEAEQVVELTLNKPHSEKQKLMITYPGNVVAFCGRRFGKTDAYVQRLFYWMTRSPGMYWWVGLSWQSASMKRAWREVKVIAVNLLRQMGLRERDYINNSR